MDVLTRFATWLVKPFVNEPEEVEDDSFLEETPPLFIPSITAPTVTTKTVFRPTSFKQFMGQESAKLLLQKFIAGTQARNKPFPHTLICGQPGYGKTTLARIIAAQLNLPILEVIGNEASSINLLEQLNSGVLFIDEIHSVPRETAETLYPLMEDFVYKGRPVPPFTLVGATTEVGEILKNRKPFYDRFKIIINLAEYSLKELSSIFSQYQKKVFPEDKIKSHLYYMIAENCRATPRHGIRLLETTIYFQGEISQVLDSFNIIFQGYTYEDLKVLEYLAQNPKGVGMQGLTAYLSTTEDNYIYAIEPYLLKSGLVSRTPRGRKITEQGLKFMEKLLQMTKRKGI